MRCRLLAILFLCCFARASAASLPTDLGDDQLSALAPHPPSAFVRQQLSESTHRAERAPAAKLDMYDFNDVDDGSVSGDFANAEEYIQTGRLWPGTSVSRVAHRDPSVVDGGAQNARDDAAFDGNKAAQALAVAQRAEQQAQEVARKVSQAQSEINGRLDGLGVDISGLKSASASRSSAVQAIADSTKEQFSRMRGEFKVIEQKVTNILPLADTVQAQGAIVKSIRSSIDSMRDTLNTLNFASKEARQEASNRITAINARISSIAATAAQQSQLSALQAAVAKLAADQSARDASVSSAMKDIYASIRQLRVIKMTPGPKGDKGDKGDKGNKGDRGPRGLPGSNGQPGRDGQNGRAGQPGPAGGTGARGAVGPRGFNGLPGTRGSPGAAGPPGNRGAVGRRGFPGKAGVGRGSQGVDAAFLREFYGEVRGVVRRASDAAFVAGATVRLMADKKVLRTVTSQTNGRFTISAPGGSYILSISGIPSMSGVEFTEPVDIFNSRTTRRTYAVAPAVQNGQLRIVLTWGEIPRDLDSHLDLPSGCHVFYGRKQCGGGEASLDTDVTDSFGPETINVRKLNPGVYKYKVHAFSSGAIEQSEASVSLYGVKKDPITFAVGRDGQVKGGDWLVFNLKVDRNGKVALVDPTQ